jgi:hypothetical protein
MRWKSLCWHSHSGGGNLQYSLDPIGEWRWAVVIVVVVQVVEISGEPVQHWEAR